MHPRPMVQTALFEDVDPTPLPQLPTAVQSEVLQQMVVWIRQLAMAIDAEQRDERQDHR